MKRRLTVQIPIFYCFGVLAVAQYNGARQRLVGVPDPIAQQLELGEARSDIAEIKRRLEVTEALKLHDRMLTIEVRLSESAKLAEINRTLNIGVLIPVVLLVASEILKWFGRGPQPKS